MTWYKTSTPNPGSYNVPDNAKILGGSEYNRVISASAGFICTGSNGGVLALTTAGCTVTLTGGGSVVLGTTTSPIELSVYQITAGSAFLYYR